LASSITETGGRIPGSKRVHPQKLGNGEIAIAEAVMNDLNIWSEKLGLAKLT